MTRYEDDYQVSVLYDWIEALVKKERITVVQAADRIEQNFEVAFKDYVDFHSDAGAREQE